MSAVVAEANAQFIGAIDAATTDEDAGAAYQIVVEAYRTAVATIRAMEFPPEIQPEVDALASGYEAMTDIYAALVVDPGDPDPTIGDRLQGAADQVTLAATAIRSFLGLPPPPTPIP